ncbi:MAG: NDP-hexose 4-ketoreductase, partial [Chloroflexales bacterium]
MSGNLVRLGASWRLTIKLHDVRTGALLSTEMVSAATDDDEAPTSRRTEGKSGASEKVSDVGAYCVELVSQAKAGKIDALIGRTQEVERVVNALNRRLKNNICLTGETGVGKTAIVEGFALRIANGDVPESLKGYEVYALDMGA